MSAAIILTRIFQANRRVIPHQNFIFTARAYASNTWVAYEQRSNK